MNKLSEVLIIWLVLSLVVTAIPAAVVGVFSFVIWDLPDITLSEVLGLIRFSVALSGLITLCNFLCEKFYDV